MVAVTEFFSKGHSQCVYLCVLQCTAQQMEIGRGEGERWDEGPGMGARCQENRPFRWLRILLWGKFLKADNCHKTCFRRIFV